MDSAVVISIVYFLVRALTGPLPEALSTSLTLMALLLAIMRLLKAQTIGAAYGWIARHWSESIVYVMVVALVVGAAVWRGSDVMRVMLHSVLFLHVFWLFDLLRRKIKNRLRGRDEPL